LHCQQDESLNPFHEDETERNRRFKEYTMARGINHVYLLGTITQEPELRYSGNNLPVLNITVAGDDHIIDHNGTERSLPWYHRVTMLGRMGELLKEQLQVGDPVLVEGSLDFRAWEDAETGQKRSMVSVKAGRIDKALVGTRTSPVVTDARGGTRLANALNEVVLVGNLTQDTEIRYTGGGDAFLTLNMAVNESWQDRSGERQDKVHFVVVTLWRDLAEANRGLKKGDPVLVMGRLTNESWTDKDGKKRQTTKVEGRRVEHLARGSASGDGGTTRPAGRPASGTAPTRVAPPSSGGRGGGSRASKPQPEADDFSPDEDLPF
jgi:single-strand DNA-binding protein